MALVERYSIMQRRDFFRSVVRHTLLLATSAIIMSLTTGRLLAAQLDRYDELRKQLEYGLRARRPVEFEFIAHVVDMVEAGQLPYDIVMASFNWARKKQPYPFQYFIRAVRALARQKGIEV